MTELKFSCPLKWPGHQPETQRLQRQNNAQFPSALTEEEAVNYLQMELLQTLEIQAATLHCNAQHIASTQPTQYMGNNPGATLEMRISGHSYILACDRWASIAQNIYALHLIIRQLRQLSSWGVGDFAQWLDGVTGNHNARSAANGTNNGANDWHSALGLGPTATLEDANAVYRHRALKIGENDPDALQVLNLAIQAARRELRD